MHLGQNLADNARRAAIEESLLATVRVEDPFLVVQPQQAHLPGQIITHEGGLQVAGLYVDLNLIRAGEAQTPVTSVYTSAWFRIQARQTAANRESTTQPIPWISVD